MRARVLTGPTRSGTYSSITTMLPRMKKKPSRVTRFGASHMGSSSTKPFHCRDTLEPLSCAAARAACCLGPAGKGRAAYVVLEDVSRDEGLVDARILVRPEMLQRVLGHALVRGGLCSRAPD